MPDRPVDIPPDVGEPRTPAAAIAELALCDSLAATSGWAARWSAVMSGADAALLWAPDPLNPVLLCIASWGEGVSRNVKRSVSREQGIVAEVIHDRKPMAFDHEEIARGADSWLKGLPADVKTCLTVPLESEGVVVGVLALLFRKAPDMGAALARVRGFLELAVPALSHALRAERKTVGMLHAIERLTNLYDLTKAFGSTIDLAELNDLVVRKAVDFGNAEAASLWILDADSGEVVLAATAVSQNYEVAHPPEAIGASIVGDVVAERQPIRRNSIASDDPLAADEPEFELRSILAIPMLEEEEPIGTLVLANKRGRHPEFTDGDEELMVDLARQAVRGIHNARLYEAEKKVEELDALLTVSREITATLDLDKVLKTIVNASSALITYDRCAIAIQERGRLRLGAVSGAAEVNRSDPSIKRLEDLLQWVFLSGTDVSVTQEDGQIVADRPETVEKFRSFFEETGVRSFYAVLLQDEEGKLGVLAFESREPLIFDEETRSLLDILVNQATVSVRNAQLYQEVPLVGFWKPLLERRRKFMEIPKQRRLAWSIGAGVALLLLIVLPWQTRVEGPVRISPAQRAIVTAGVEGVVGSVLHTEGDSVAAHEVIALLRDDAYRAELANAQSALAIAESDMARARDAGDPAAAFEAQSRRDEARAREVLAQARLARTRLESPTAGVILTPHLEDRVGQRLAAGEVFCVVGDAKATLAEVAIPEDDASFVHAGAPAAVKLNAYPTRTFGGSVVRVGAEIHEEGAERFLTVEVRVPNSRGLLKAGMLGKAKVADGTHRLIVALLRGPARYLWKKLWPLVP